MSTNLGRFVIFVRQVGGDCVTASLSLRSSEGNAKAGGGRKLVDCLIVA